MNTNTRFSVGVHILVMLALHRQTPCTSDHLAQSVKTNAVVIRRLIGLLKKAGLVTVRAGVGGAALCLPPEHISLLDVYKAMSGAQSTGLFVIHSGAHSVCCVAEHMQAALDQPLYRAEEAMRASLATTSLADIANRIRHLIASIERA